MNGSEEIKCGTETLQNVLSDCHEILDRSCFMASGIRDTLFGAASENTADKKEVCCAFDAVCDMRWKLQDLSRMLESIQERL